MEKGVLIQDRQVLRKRQKGGYTTNRNRQLAPATGRAIILAVQHLSAIKNSERIEAAS